jgi:phosphoesterase RecJ-like protein
MNTKLNCPSDIIRAKAPEILEAVKQAKSILLHCHPGPDPDSVGSALAMKFVLGKLGKKATIIKGDSDIPEAFMHFPGTQDIVKQDYFETDLSNFDLFLIQDTAALNMISKKGEIVFPKNLKTVVIDHHKSNNIQADISLVEYSYPATAQILTDLFLEWNVEFDRNIAENLFVGLYTDTLFKYAGVTSHTFEVATLLSKYIPKIKDIIYPIDNSATPASLSLQGIGFSNIEVFCDNHFAISSITYDQLLARDIKETDISPHLISTQLRTVKGWYFSVCLIETKPNYIRASFRSQDGDKYDVSILASTIGDGGHKDASGATANMSLHEVKKVLVKKAEEMYNQVSNNN